MKIKEYFILKLKNSAAFCNLASFVTREPTLLETIKELISSSSSTRVHEALSRRIRKVFSLLLFYLNVIEISVLSVLTISNLGILCSLYWSNLVYNLIIHLLEIRFPMSFFSILIYYRCVLCTSHRLRLDYLISHKFLQRDFLISSLISQWFWNFRLLHEKLASLSTFTCYFPLISRFLFLFPTLSLVFIDMDRFCIFLMCCRISYLSGFGKMWNLPTYG